MGLRAIFEAIPWQHLLVSATEASSTELCASFTSIYICHASSTPPRARHRISREFLFLDLVNDTLNGVEPELAHFDFKCCDPMSYGSYSAL